MVESSRNGLEFDVNHHSFLCLSRHYFDSIRIGNGFFDHLNRQLTTFALMPEDARCR